MAEKWNTLDRNSQRYIATIAAGSRQQSRFIAMMENYDRTLELVDTAYNSAGKSSKQFAKYQDTVEYKTKQLSNIWEQLRTGFLDSDTYKNAIDMLNNLLTKINEFNGIDFIKLGSIWLIFGKTAIEKFIKGMQSSINGIRGVFNKALSSIDQIIMSKLAKTNLGKKIGINIPLNITSEQAEAEIAQLKLKIEELKSNNKIFLDLNDEQINSELQRIELEIKKVQAEAQRMMSLDIAQNRNPQSMNYYTKEAYKNLGYNAGEHQSANEYKNYNNRIKQLENDQTSKQAAQLRGQAVGQAFSIGLTTAITSYMTANNPMDVFKYTMITTLTSAIPAIVGVFTTMGLSASAAFTATGIGAIIVGIGVLIGGVTAGIKAFSDYTEKQAKKQAAANDEYYEAVQELERLENIQEELNETLDEANKKYDKTKEELDTLVKLQDEYEDYANKIALTTEEKEEFLEIQNEIAEQYPELISYYDEEGNAILTKIGGAWDEVINKKEEYFKIAAEEQAQAEVEANVGNLLIAQTELQKETGFSKDIESDFIKFLSGITNANRAGGDTYWKWDPEKKNVYYNYSSNQQIYATEANYGKEGRAGSSDTQLTMVGVLSGLNESEKELYGELFKEIDARNEAIDLGIKNLESGDVIDEIIDQLASGGREDEQEYLQKFKNAIAQTSDIDLNSYTKQVEQAEQALDESLGGLVEAQIATLDEYTDVSKNTQVLMHNFLTKDYGLTYEELMVQFYEAASKEEYIDESWFDENGELLSSAPLEKVNTAIQTYVHDYSDKLGIDAQTLADKLNTTFNEQTRAYLDNFFNTVDKEGWSIIEQVKYINNSNLSQDIKDSFYEVNEALIEAYNNQMNYIAAAMGETARKINENGTIEKGGIYQEKIATFSDTAQTQIYNLAQSGASEERMKEYINLLSSDSFVQYEDIFGQIDLSKSYGELLANKDQYINLLHEQGIGIEQATKLVKDYLQKAALILGQGLTSKDQIGLLTAQWNQYIGEFSDKYSDLIDIQNEFLEEGEVSIESYNKLVEAGLEEYVDYTSDGITLLKNDFEQLWTDAALQPVKELEQAINTEERLLQDWKDTSETFNNISVNADIYPDVNVRDFKKNKGYDFTNIDDYIKYYKETGVLLDNLTDKQKEYITTIAENYDTEIEFLNSRQEIISELNKEQPNTYIKSLRLLKEAAEQADEEVEDLKEDLEDLNKQLEEDKEALAEAEDELRQAIHGSDDFQSSLDGLVNYTEKIERLDKAIEKTKEALEDVSDVDESKGLMAQLNEQYDNKTISLGAENMAIDAALENLRSTLTENYGDYISFDEEGNPLIDFAYMTMDANDEIRKAFEEEYNLYNEYRDKQINNLDAIAEIEKAKQEQRERALQNFVSIQEDVISTLKEKAQEEIDVTKEKYDALEEADNDYLDALQDAIDKQRKLRDKQNQYEDLATKEKKLSLLQRDTSGANQKEALTLQNEIEDDRQNLLDSEIDSTIESMKELYEKQKEARDAEIEYMEEVTEDTQYFAEWASNIMSTWQSAEDMQAWYLENNPNAQDMTVEQTEVYLNEIGDKYSDYVQYIATLATDFTTEQEELNAAMNEMYENTSTNVENIGTVTQDLAQAAADKAIEEATKARDDARDKLEETQKKIDETTKKLNAAEDTAVQKHSAAMQAMIDASQESMEEVSGYATKILADMLGVDLTDEKQAEKFATTYGFKDKNDKYSENFREAVEAAGGDKSKYEGTTKYKIMGYSGGNSNPFLIEENYDSLEKARAAAEKIKSEKKYAGVWVEGISSSTQYGKIDSNKVQNKYKIVTPTNEVIADGFISEQEAYDYAKQKKLEGNSKYNTFDIRKYAQGGLVNYTGPAWVDGTKSKPEAFLNAEDTKRIGDAAKILADIPLLNSNPLSENAISTNIGDTTIEIHINVENIDSDYDVDKMIERVKKDIVDVSKPVGTSVILNK